jgi:hypothetical protein
MGSHLFDFLTESFLFRQDLIAEEFAQTPVSEIEKELRSYREFCIKNRAEMFTESASGGSSLTLYDPEHLSLRELTQAAFYVDRYILKDPLLRFTETRSESAKVLAKGSICPPGDEGLRLGDLSRTLGELKTLTPMVATDFVKFVPSSLDS